MRDRAVQSEYSFLAAAPRSGSWRGREPGARCPSGEAISYAAAPMRPRRILPAALPLLLGLGSCFEGPERVDSQALRAGAPRETARPVDTSQGLPEGHPPIPGTLPPGHPPLPGMQAGSPHGSPHGEHGAPSGEPIFAGYIVLAGEIAHRSEGAVFVIARAPGQAGSLLVRKLELSDGELRADGTRSIPFELSEQDSHGAQIPAQVQIEVYYDPDGIVETREGRVGRTQSALRGDLQLRIVLDPDQAPAAGGY